MNNIIQYGDRSLVEFGDKFIENPSILDKCLNIRTPTDRWLIDRIFESMWKWNFDRSDL